MIDALGDIQVSGSGSKVGTGGMVTKLEAARVAAVSASPRYSPAPSNAGPADDGRSGGHRVRTRLRPAAPHAVCGSASPPTRAARLWSMRVPARAIRGGRASLLAAGALEVHGDFSAGDPVWIDAESGEHLARGLAGFDSEEIPQMLGRNTAQLKRFLGPSTPTHWFIAIQSRASGGLMESVTRQIPSP